MDEIIYFWIDFIILKNEKGPWPNYDKNSIRRGMQYSLIKI